MNEIGQDSFLKRHSVTVFFVLVLLIGFGMVVPLMLTGNALFGLLAASSASIAGLITAASTGNLKWLLSGFLRWRCNPLWYIIAIFIPAVTILISIGVSRVFGNQFQIQCTVSLASVVPIFLMITLQAGLGEEIGWRGFVTPKLMEKRSALKSSLIVGAVWSVWHAPLYFFPGFIQYTLVQEIGFPLTVISYSANVFALAIVHSWIYEASNRNLWLPILLHGSLNAFASFFAYSNFEVYGISVVMINVLLWVILAVAVVLIYGPQLFSKSTQ
ncbi:CPBP family intramembrane glutamic endopeptidase [Chloroflexota bacterium]